MPPDTATTWAKLARDENGTVTAALPLLDHGLDVAAAFEALLAGGAWDEVLAMAAGRALTSHDRVRLLVLVALHDIGKANAGFQARRREEAPRVGHTGQVAALLCQSKLKESEAGRALRALIESWDAMPHFAALMAHHGRPLAEFREDATSSAWLGHVACWQPAGNYHPVAEAARLIEQVRARWPEAWEPGEPLPAADAFVSLLAGLVTLADWLGSDTDRFPVDGPYGADRDALRQREAARAVAAEGLGSLPTPLAGFAAAFGFAPRGVQREAAADDLGPVALIEAETGSGKTEAALWRWLELRRRGEVDGLFFALPTRTAAVQLHERVNKMLRDVWGAEGPAAILAVPGYLRVGDVEGQAAPNWRTLWDDDRADGRWAAERTNRFLAARVAVGTIDQALLGALPVKHAHLRAAALSRSLLVVDEVHASDAYMTGLLGRLLANHLAAGGRALLLSATLGGAARARLLGGARPTRAEAEAAPYPALSGTAAAPRAVAPDGRADKRVRIEVAGLIDDPAAIAGQAVAAAREGASVLVIRNSVAGAVAVAQAVEALAPELAFRVEGAATVHHGRFAPTDRRRLDAAVERAFGKGRSAAGRVLVGTQTLEQSLDIDADLLLTDVAPMDVLLQRIGRLHRHDRHDRGAFVEARVVVLRPEERDLTPLLAAGPRHGLGMGKGRQGAYVNLLQIEATLRRLEADNSLAIPADNRRLVEGALHPEVLDELADALGTAWINHAADCASIVHAALNTAGQLALDLSAPFRDLVFPKGDVTVATRLGAKDLLVDLDPPLAGPFGAPVDRVAIPHWMAPEFGVQYLPEPLMPQDGAERFRLGPKAYAYNRWGLRDLT